MAVTSSVSSDIVTRQFVLNENTPTVIFTLAGVFVILKNGAVKIKQVTRTSTNR